MRALRSIAVLAALALLAGCTNYGYIVRTENAPLYSDSDRDMVMARMERLADGYIGHCAPKGDPVEIDYHGRTGYANRADLRIFKYHNDDESRAFATYVNRREVILEGKDWPENYKDAIRANRVENGMTKEMVKLAWGPPSGVHSLEGGGERWVYERTRYVVHEHVYYDYYYPFYPSHFYYGYGPWGPRWGFAYTFPYYEPRYYRTYYPRIERRTVTFNAAGVVTGWEATPY